MTQQKHQHAEISFEDISSIAAQNVLLDENYQTDMLFVKTQMLLSLTVLKSDFQFVSKMRSLDVHYATFDENKLTEIRNDIWQRFIKILNTAYYLNSPHIESEVSEQKNQLLEQCKIEYKKLIDYLIVQKYIPQVNSLHIGYSFWSSRLGQHAALECYKTDGDAYLNDVIVSQYYARLLSGWRSDDILRVTDGKQNSLNVTYDLLRHDRPKEGYAALSMFYWQAHSRAYTAFITQQSKVKLFIQDALQEDNFFFNAELPLLREQGVSIQLMFLKKHVDKFLIQFTFNHLDVIYKISHAVLSIHYFKKSLLISTVDGSIIQMTKNRKLIPDGYELSFIRLGSQLKELIPVQCHGQHVYLSKQEALHSFHFDYSAAWENMGSIDTIPLDHLFIRRIDAHYVRSKIKNRSYLVDKLLLNAKNPEISITNQLAHAPFSEYCVYVSNNSQKSSLWKMAYERCFLNAVDLMNQQLDEAQLDHWVAGHKKDDVLYYQSEEEKSVADIRWKKMTVINHDQRIVCIKNIQNPVLSEADNISMLATHCTGIAIALRHAHHQEKHTQLFGTQFFIKESIKMGASAYQIIMELENRLRHLIWEVRTSINRLELLSYIQYDMSYQLNQLCFRSLTHHELTKLITAIALKEDMHIQPRILKLLQNKLSRLRPNYYMRRSLLTLAPQYWPESYSSTVLMHLHDEAGDQVAIYRDRYNKLKTYIQEKIRVTSHSFSYLVKQVTIETLLDEIGVHLLKYINPEHLSQYEIDAQAFQLTGELQTVSGYPLDKTGRQNLIVLLDEKLYIHRKIIPNNKTIGFSHSSFSQGRPLESSASLLFEKEQWVLENTSGHYEPRITHLGKILSALELYGLSKEFFSVRGQIPHICPTLINKKCNTGFTPLAVPMVIFKTTNVPHSVSWCKFFKQNMNQECLNDATKKTSSMLCLEH